MHYFITDIISERLNLKIIQQDVLKNQTTTQAIQNITSFPNRLFCRECSITSFGSLDEMRAHYKTKDHLNMLRIRESVSQEISQEFQFQSNGPFLFVNVNGEDFKIYKKIFLKIPENNDELIYELNLLKNCIWTIILIRNGSVSFSVFSLFKSNNIVFSKNIKKYTTRKGQGRSQSSADSKNSGSRIKSAGSQLRRHNEASLITEVGEILNSELKMHISTSHSIFWVDNIYAQSCLFKNKIYNLDKSNLNYFIIDDSRLKTIPFEIHKPSFEECKRCFDLLTRVSPDF